MVQYRRIKESKADRIRGCGGWQSSGRRPCLPYGRRLAARNRGDLTCSACFAGQDARLYGRRGRPPLLCQPRWNPWHAWRACV